MTHTGIFVNRRFAGSDQDVVPVSFYSRSGRSLSSLLFALLFIAAGLLPFFWLVLAPALEAWQSQGWEGLANLPVQPDQLLFVALLLLLFGGIGSGLLYLFWTTGRADVQQRELLQNGPPAGASIASIQQHGSWLFGWLGGLLLVLSVPLWWLLPQALAQQQYGRLLLVLIPVGGLWLCWRAFTLWQRFQRIGATPLMAEALPGRVGGALSGWFLCPPGRFVKPPMATLNCIEMVQSGPADRRRTEFLLRWQHQQASVLQRGRVQMSFLIPPSCLPTGDSQQGRIHWELSCCGDLEWPDGQHTEFFRSWRVPVLPVLQASSIKRT